MTMNSTTEEIAMNSTTVTTKRGKLIVFEGPDRVGKSTQVKLLVQFLQSSNRQVVVMNFPNRQSRIGKVINSFLSSDTNDSEEGELNLQTMHLLFSANRWEFQSQIIQYLLKGTDVILDRYFYSGIVYSLAQQTLSQHQSQSLPTTLEPLSREWFHKPDIGLVNPDIIIHLDIDVHQAATRQGYGLEKLEKVQLQEQVRLEFLSLFSSNELVRRVDASESVERVHALVVEGVKSVLLVEKGIQYNQ